MSVGGKNLLSFYGDLRKSKHFLFFHQFKFTNFYKQKNDLFQKYKNKTNLEVQEEQCQPTRMTE